MQLDTPLCLGAGEYGYRVQRYYDITLHLRIIINAQKNFVTHQTTNRQKNERRWKSITHLLHYSKRNIIVTISHYTWTNIYEKYKV